MPKPNTYFQCQTCGYISPKWLGKCPDCGTWNSFVEEVREITTNKSRYKKDTERSEPFPLNSIKGEIQKRTNTSIKELDRALGGGIVAGSVVLIGGDPGIGKSTLLLQALSSLSEVCKKHVLYVSGEESPEQIKMRADRLGINSEYIMLFSETSVNTIMKVAHKISPKALVIDSIQTMYTDELVSAPGSVSQVRECATRLMHFAKKTNIPVFIVGHVTKEGSIAGPRILEHIVDTVLYFEGDSNHAYRILRAVKNRFGSTNEIGVFEMSDDGLKGIENPSELFLLERPINVSGSVVVACIEGTRPLLVELQSLVSQTNFGMPRRTSLGVDYNRVNLLIAVLEKKVGFHLGGMDIFVNVAGGIKVYEPAIDLGIIATITSSYKDFPIDPRLVVFGEVGLSGEVRAVNRAELRLKESANTGFKKAIIPFRNYDTLKEDYGMNIIGVRNVDECLKNIFN